MVTYITDTSVVTYITDTSVVTYITDTSTVFTVFPYVGIYWVTGRFHTQVLDLQPQNLAQIT